METIKIKHTCGHEVEHRFSAAHPGAKDRIAWLKDQPCQLCWKEKQTRAARESSAASGLPELEGAEDELSWAETIRDKAIRHNRAFYDKLTGSKKVKNKEDETIQEVVASATEAMERLESEPNAAWWIDNRLNVVNYVRKAATAAVERMHDAEND